MADASLVQGSDLVDVVADVLAEHGPLAEEQLIDVLIERGVDLGDDPDLALEKVLDGGDGLLAVLADDRWVALPALLAGRVFTHRLTGPEVEHDILRTSPDLDLVDLLVPREQYRRLTDGTPVARVLLPFDADAVAGRGIPPEEVDDLGVLLLPAGCLRGRGLAEGDVIALRVAADGLRLEAVGDQETQPERQAGPERRLEEILAENAGEPVPLGIAVLTVCALDRASFTEPLPPLSEVLDACGLVHDGEWLAPRGFDLGRWWAGKRCATIAGRHGLDDDEALAVLAIVTLYERVADLHAAALDAQEGGEAELIAFAAELTGRPVPGSTEPDRPDGTRAAVRTVLPVLAEPAVAEAVLAETIGAGGEGAAALGLFAETLEPLAPRAARPAARWLRGKAYEGLGDPAAAEAAYQVAESLDPHWPPALVDLARYASDRGDAARGLALLRRAGMPRDHVLVGLLERFEAGPRSDVARNEPCWCGSGRKYKKCHLHNERVALDERAAWLYEKASMFLADGPWRGAVLEVAQARAQFSDAPYALLHALEDPLVTDAVLFESGAFAEFLRVRGALLPDDERLLAEQWLLAERSVYELEQVRHGQGVTARDVRTGDIHQVRERAASRQLTAGTLICARVVPAGDTTQIFGIEPVALHERDALVALLDSEPGAVELVAFLSRRFAPPALQNTEGDPLVLCEATLKTGDPAALTAGLDETYERDDDPGSTRWFEHVTAHGTEQIRATLRLDGHELIVEANSEARIDRVLDTLHALDPTLTIIGQTRRPARDTREVATPLADLPAGAEPVSAVDPAGPEIAAALEAFIRDYERKWLDEPIPALAGHTPREAAADPTRRGDLIRLLDSFPSGVTPGRMSPDRLRTALDLP